MKTNLKDKGYFTTGKDGEGMGVFCVIEFEFNPYVQNGGKKPVRRFFCTEGSSSVFTNGVIGVTDRDKEGLTTYEVTLFLGCARSIPAISTNEGYESNLEEINNLDESEISSFKEEEKIHLKNVRDLVSESFKVKEDEVKLTGYIIAFPYDGRGENRFVCNETPPELRRHGRESSGVKIYHGGEGSSVSQSKSYQDVVRRSSENEEENRLLKEVIRKKEEEIQILKVAKDEEIQNLKEENRGVKERLEMLEKKIRKRKRDEEEEEEDEKDGAPAKKKRKI